MTEWTVLVWIFVGFSGAMFAMTIYRDKEKDMATTFSWRNYTRPTPRNVLRMAEFIQGTLLGISTISVAMGNDVSSMVINVSIIVINRAVKFIGDIVDESKTETVTAEFPSGDEITLTHEKPKDEGEE